MAPKPPDRSTEAARKAWDHTFMGQIPSSVSDPLFVASRIERAPAGEIVMRGDDPSCYVLVDGLVRIFIRAADGRQLTVHYVQPGDIAGLAPLLVGSMPITAETVTDVTLICLPSSQLMATAEKELSLAWAMAHHIAKTSTNAVSGLSSRIFLRVRSRVANSLLDLAQREDAGLVVSANHQQIADAIGSVREVVSREMKQFDDEGLIARVPGGTLLVDAAALHRVAAGDRDVTEVGSTQLPMVA